MFVCHEISAHAQKLEFFDEAGFPTVAEIMIWPRRLIVSNITSHFLYLSVGR